MVLLILAGVSLSAVFSENGIFSREEQAGDKYNEAKAREVLETVLMADTQYEKYINPAYNQDDYLDKLIKKEIEGAEVKGDVAMIGEYAYELDRSVPKIGRYLGTPKGLAFPNRAISWSRGGTFYVNCECTIAEKYATRSRNCDRKEIMNSIQKYIEKISQYYKMKQKGHRNMFFLIL